MSWRRSPSVPSPRSPRSTRTRYGARTSYGPSPPKNSATACRGAARAAIGQDAIMTDSAAGRPLLRRPGEGELIEVAGVDHLFRLTATQTGGRFAFEEFTLDPGVLGARPHVHHGHDE